MLNTQRDDDDCEEDLCGELCWKSHEVSFNEDCNKIIIVNRLITV